MCCFSQPTPTGWRRWLGGGREPVRVSSTRLFARRDGGAQYLAYQMALDAPGDVAMVLPLPVARVADDALAFVDLSRAPQLFDQLARLFPNMAPQVTTAARSLRKSAPAPRLVVHEVGSFEASYVPSLADMTRLDPRFRISDEIWRALPQYAAFGFAVFTLKRGARTIHPMAMRFDSAEPGSLFFPTVHVHDGALHATAGFDHELYAQADALGSGEVAERAHLPAPAHVVIENTRGVVDARAPVWRKQLRGVLDNRDTRIALA